MQFIESNNDKEGIRALSKSVIDSLMDGKKVLWLIPGGSNIPITVEAMNIVRRQTKPSQLHNLSITLTDERYGPLNHPDSNWKQLIEAGLNISGIQAFPVLSGLSIDETVDQYCSRLEKLLSDSDLIIGQFGMGSDGHIAGILPHTKAVSETRLALAYESTKFTRITVTFSVFRQIDAAFLFVSKASKLEAIQNLKKDSVSLTDQPAQILKEIPDVYVFIK